MIIFPIILLGCWWAVPIFIYIYSNRVDKRQQKKYAAEVKIEKDLLLHLISYSTCFFQWVLSDFIPKIPVRDSITLYIGNAFRKLIRMLFLVASHSFDIHFLSSR